MDDTRAAAVSPSTIRSILKMGEIGGPGILMMEDPYGDVLVQSINFSGGPYLVSGGSGDYSVSDLELLFEAAFRDGWMPDALRSPMRQLVRGLLTVSDIVLKRAGLVRGIEPAGYAQTPMEVPGAARLKLLTEATFVSNDELDSHGPWLRMVVDTFALSAGELVDPCADDYTDDRLQITPFLRLADGYRVVLPLDLTITIRFHLLRFAWQEGALGTLGEKWRDAAFRRFQRMVPHDGSFVELERAETHSRYLTKIDDQRDLHLILATDPLVDWQPEVWGSRDTRPVLERIFELLPPEVRAEYSSAEELVHVVVTDSPGRGAFWGVPDVDGADPVLIARTDDLETILHQEPDGVLGLLLFAQAIERRPGRSMSTSVLDEFSAYVDLKKSFYLSDAASPSFVSFQPGDGLNARLKFARETDRHGVIAPTPDAEIIQVQRRWERDAPEIFITSPYGSYIGCVVELSGHAWFITVDLGGSDLVGVEPDLLDCVAYWIRECALQSGLTPERDIAELVLRLTEPDRWRKMSGWSTSEPAVRAIRTDHRLEVEFTETFASLLGRPDNEAERELVAALLTNLFGSVGSTSALDQVAPLGEKRLIQVFSQEHSPDMLADDLPKPLTGHGQVTSQLLDELGEWLRSIEGGGYGIGPFEGTGRVDALNSAVSHLFARLEAAIVEFNGRSLLNFLIAQNESLLHSLTLSARLLRSRLACFGEQSHTVSDLVEERTEVSAAHRANRFLIEYVAAQPPRGTATISDLDYYRLLGIAQEISERGSASDMLHYGLADFEVSILESGRLGVSREQPLMAAMERYATDSGTRSVRDALRADSTRRTTQFDGAAFLDESASPMLAEFGFTLTQLRDVCGGLLDLAAADHVTRLDHLKVITAIADQRAMTEETVSEVVSAITLAPRRSFLSIGPDAFPWRFSRDMSYIRRPLVLQGDEVVFGFRGIYRLGAYWADMLLSGRLQARATTNEMQQYISRARGNINEEFARGVAARLRQLGMQTKLSVKKVDGLHIAGSAGQDLGDVDVLAIDLASRSILAIEAKDFEIARTPVEIANELKKLFTGAPNKKPTIELHGRRIEWVKDHIHEVLASFGVDGGEARWRVFGAVVTSEPLLTPLARSRLIPVIAFEDLDLASLGLVHTAGRSRRGKRP